MMKQWRNVTETFSEDARHYSGTYLEIDEVYDEVVEVSLFTPDDENDPYEIYLSYGILYGIIYADSEEEAVAKREEVKKVLEEEYQRHKEPTGEFINVFCEKYKVKLPNDVLFNFPMESFMKCFDDLDFE